MLLPLRVLFFIQCTSWPEGLFLKASKQSLKEISSATSACGWGEFSSSSAPLFQLLSVFTFSSDFCSSGAPSALELQKTEHSNTSTEQRWRDGDQESGLDKLNWSVTCFLQDIVSWRGRGKVFEWDVRGKKKIKREMLQLKWWFRLFSF